MREGRITGLRTEKFKTVGQGVAAKRIYPITMIKDIATKLKDSDTVEKILSELVDSDGDFGVVKNYGRKW